jgi:hypothetical protein
MRYFLFHPIFLKCQSFGGYIKSLVTDYFIQNLLFSINSKCEAGAQASVSGIKL